MEFEKMDAIKKEPFAIRIGKSKALALVIARLLSENGKKTGAQIPEDFAHYAFAAYALDGIVYFVYESNVTYGDVPYYTAHRSEYSELLDARTQMGEIIDRLEKKPISVKLNEGYTAVVADDLKTVTVGCQTFEVSKIQQLIDAINAAK